MSSLYRTELVTPARLVVPNFGPQSPEIAVACTAGDLSGSATARIRTFWQEPPGYWGYPGAGPYGFYRPFGWGWSGGAGLPGLGLSRPHRADALSRAGAPDRLDLQNASFWAI